MTTVNYEADIVAWANEQAWLVRNKKFELLDIGYIAEELEDVGKNEQRELAIRLVICASGNINQSASWQATIAAPVPERLAAYTPFLAIKTQRERVKRRLKRTPCLKSGLKNSECRADARDAAEKETGVSYEKLPGLFSCAIEIPSDNWFS